MRSTLFLAISVVALLSISCRKTILGVGFGEKFTLAPGQSAIVKDRYHMAHLYFIKVMEDTRCATFPHCAEKGNFVVQIRIANDTLLISPGPVSYSNFKISLLNSAPVKGTTDGPLAEFIIMYALTG